MTRDIFKLNQDSYLIQRVARQSDIFKYFLLWKCSLNFKNLLKICFDYLLCSYLNKYTSNIVLNVENI